MANPRMNWLPLEFFPPPAYARYPSAKRATPSTAQYFGPQGSHDGSSAKLFLNSSGVCSRPAMPHWQRKFLMQRKSGTLAEK